MYFLAKLDCDISAMAANNMTNIECAWQILAENRDFILKIILLKVKDDEELANDIFQDFFLSLASRPLPANLADIKGYLYKMIIHDIVDATRRTERYNSHLKKYEEILIIPINKSELTDALIEEEQKNLLCEFLSKQLPGSNAKAITYRFGDDQSIQEVADTMGVKRRSVSKYIAKGLEKLRQILLVQERTQK